MPAHGRSRRTATRAAAATETKKKNTSIPLKESSGTSSSGNSKKKKKKKHKQPTTAQERQRAKPHLETVPSSLSSTLPRRLPPYWEAAAPQTRTLVSPRTIVSEIDMYVPSSTLHSKSVVREKAKDTKSAPKKERRAELTFRTA